MELITTAMAAKMLGCAQAHVRRLILEGKLAGQKVGKTWIIDPESLAKYERPKRGRPPTS